MDTLILMAIGVALFAWAFKQGKREGSQKAYHVGREHAKRLYKRFIRR